MPYWPVQVDKHAKSDKLTGPEWKKTTLTQNCCFSNDNFDTLYIPINTIYMNIYSNVSMVQSYRLLLYEMFGFYIILQYSEMVKRQPNGKVLEAALVPVHTDHFFLSFAFCLLYFSQMFPLNGRNPLNEGSEGDG